MLDLGMDACLELVDFVDERVDGLPALPKLQHLPARMATCQRTLGLASARLAASVPHGISPLGVSQRPKPQRDRAPTQAPMQIAMTARIVGAIKWSKFDVNKERLDANG